MKIYFQLIEEKFSMKLSVKLNQESCMFHFIKSFSLNMLPNTGPVVPSGPAYTCAQNVRDGRKEKGREHSTVQSKPNISSFQFNEGIQIEQIEISVDTQPRIREQRSA